MRILLGRFLCCRLHIHTLHPNPIDYKGLLRRCYGCGELFVHALQEHL